MTQKSVEERVLDVVTDILRGESFEEGFGSLVLHTDEYEQSKKQYAIEAITKFWTTVPKESHDVALRSYVVNVHKQRSENRIKVLFDLLSVLIENNHLCAKSVCEAVLNTDKLDIKNEMLWLNTFQLIRKEISAVDYKGVRDLLRVILEKSQNLNHNENVSCIKQIYALCDVVGFILDRNSCLLPAYFAVNEVTKLCSDDKTVPHWKLGKLLSGFMNSFRQTAQMVTVAGRRYLLPIVGHSLSNSSVWRLVSDTLKFPHVGPLPYDKCLQEPQTDLLRYTLEQQYSRDMVSNMLTLNKQTKQRCEVLEEQLVELVVFAMERSENEEGENEDLSYLLWQHISSQLIYFVLFQFASFPHMVLNLFDKLKNRNLNKGRDHLMWVLLQFISGSVQKNPLADFLPVMKLYDLLYLDTEMVPIPDVTKANSTHTMAATCIWIHLNKKAQSDKVTLQRPIPFALKDHLEFLKQCLASKTLTMNDYKIALLCNAYSTNTDFFNLPMGNLLEGIYGNGKNTTVLPGNVVASAPTQPLSMTLLDSLTVHAKMSLIHSIVTRVMRLAKNKSNMALAPALVETYSRLLVYMEIESLGIKGFISQLLPTVFTSHAWGILHTLLEIFSYRLHHIQPHYRVQLLSHLHTLASMQQTNQNQLQLCVESTALRLITGLGSSEVQPQLSRLFSEPKGPGFLSGDSEELNRALILTLARAVHVTGAEAYSSSWCKDILMAIMQSTPHGWPSHTLSHFPPSLSDFFQQNSVPKDDKSALKRNVEAEYVKWKTMANENEIIAHFSMQGIPSLFLCIIWKSLLEENRISPTAYKVLDRLGPRALASHLRAFTDYLVFELSTPAGGQSLTRYLEALNAMIWKWNIVTIDRFVLCMPGSYRISDRFRGGGSQSTQREPLSNDEHLPAPQHHTPTQCTAKALRNMEGNEAQVSFLLIHHLLLKMMDFRSRINDFVRENSPEHWLQSNWHDKHMAFHKKYPEKFYSEVDVSSPIQYQYLPVYFGNVCLRFLPVLDLVIHRFLELPLALTKFLENILEHLGLLYKFHDRPITYLYNTLHYYEKKLAQTGRPGIKKKLVQAVIGALREIRPPHWCLTEDYQKYLQMPPDDVSWVPTQDYYVRIVERLVDTIAGKAPAPFPECDWRFNEFPNAPAHALYSTCVELMALPAASQNIASSLLDIVLKSCSHLPREKHVAWMNAVGLILTSLPESFWGVLNERIVEAIQKPILASPGPHSQPFQLFHFNSCHMMFCDQFCSYMLGLCHAVWHHAGIGQLSLLPQFLRDKLKPLIKTEDQFIYLCHLIGPFLQRFHTERTRCLLELTVELYEIIVNVDKACTQLKYCDAISDFLYHIKYMYVGDGVKNEVEKLIRNLKPALQLRLRFISHISIEEAMSA